MEETEAEEERQFSHRQVDNKRGPSKAGRRVPVSRLSQGWEGGMWALTGEGGAWLAECSLSMREAVGSSPSPAQTSLAANDCDPSTVG